MIDAIHFDKAVAITIRFYTLDNIEFMLKFARLVTYFRPL